MTISALQTLAFFPPQQFKLTTQKKMNMKTAIALIVAETAAVAVICQIKRVIMERE